MNTRTQSLAKRYAVKSIVKNDEIATLSEEKLKVELTEVDQDIMELQRKMNALVVRKERTIAYLRSHRMR